MKILIYLIAFSIILTITAFGTYMLISIGDAVQTGSSGISVRRVVQGGGTDADFASLLPFFIILFLLGSAASVSK